jgi:hypothetical protein
MRPVVRPLKENPIMSNESSQTTSFDASQTPPPSPQVGHSETFCDFFDDYAITETQFRAIKKKRKGAFMKRRIVQR